MKSGKRQHAADFLEKKPAVSADVVDTRDLLRLFFKTWVRNGC